MTEQISPRPEEDHARHYNEESFWKKTARFAGQLGRKGLNAAFVLFYCLQDKDTPTWAKSVIVGALGYLILPLDGIPDIIPGIGLTDDLGVLVAALGTVVAYIKDEHKRRAREQVVRLIGPATIEVG